MAVRSGRSAQSNKELRIVATNTHKAIMKAEAVRRDPRNDLAGIQERRAELKKTR